MAFMEWDGSLELGDAMIDRQHRRLVELINAVHEVSQASEHSDADVMRCITAMPPTNPGSQGSRLAQTGAARPASSGDHRPNARPPTSANAAPSSASG